jgi:hypothetical protein
MKKKLLSIAAFMFATVFANAQFNVLLVNDALGASGSEEYLNIATALTNSGYEFAVLNIDTNAAPGFDVLSEYDMVIWTSANNGVNLNLWDTTEYVQYNPALRQYIESGGIIWVDGLDYIFDIYGSAPYTFVEGDFVYDVMGISVYVAQSHADDSLGSYDGLEVSYPTANNTIVSMEAIKWKWSSVWYADAFDITDVANGLFEMGPEGYDFAGKICGLNRDNVVSTSMRIGALGDGGEFVQADIDLLVKEMVDAAADGYFDPTVGIATISKEDVNLYPNPASDNITITFPTSTNASLMIFDITGKVIFNTKLEANTTSYKMNISDFKTGIYFYELTIGNTTISRKMSVIR